MSNESAADTVASRATVRRMGVHGENRGWTTEWERVINVRAGQDGQIDFMEPRLLLRRCYDEINDPFGPWNM